MSEVSAQANQIAKNAKLAASRVRTYSTSVKNRIIKNCAEALSDPHVQAKILKANKLDCEDAAQNGMSEAFIDRLKLDPSRLLTVRQSLLAVAELSDPIGQIGDLKLLPSGLKVGRMQIPLGVILFVYESRPNVTLEAAALCLKAGNAVILRGGSEAFRSNQALIECLRHSFSSESADEPPVLFVDSPDRTLLGELLKQSAYIDLVVPRGGPALIEFVRDNSKIPALFHAQGICHVYVHSAADFNVATNVVVNSKVQRPGVCNAMEAVLVDRTIASEFLPTLIDSLVSHGVEIRCCEKTLELMGQSYRSSLIPAKEADYDTEFLSLKCVLKIVADQAEAMDFIEQHGSRHTASIVTTDIKAANEFLAQVEASCVLVNASTRLNDGFQLGLGSELGISTTKLHAFGPMGLEELCARKFVVWGEGHIRTD